MDSHPFVREPNGPHSTTETAGDSLSGHSPSKVQTTDVSTDGFNHNRVIDAVNQVDSLKEPSVQHRSDYEDVISHLDSQRRCVRVLLIERGHLYQAIIKSRDRLYAMNNRMNELNSETEVIQRLFSDQKALHIKKVATLRCTVIKHSTAIESLEFQRGISAESNDKNWEISTKLEARSRGNAAVGQQLLAIKNGLETLVSFGQDMEDCISHQFYNNVCVDSSSRTKKCGSVRTSVEVSWYNNRENNLIQPKFKARHSGPQKMFYISLGCESASGLTLNGALRNCQLAKNPQKRLVDLLGRLLRIEAST